MDELIDVIKIFDKDSDGFLDQEELAEFQKEVEYNFNQKEIDMFNLNVDNVSMDNVVMALNYKEDDVTQQKYEEFMSKYLDGGNEGKVFVPGLINLLRNNKLIDNNDIIELVSKLPHDDNYFKYKN